MKPSFIITLFLQALLVCVRAVPNATATNAVALPKLEKFAPAAGNVVNTLNPDEKVENAIRDFDDAVELNPNSVTPAIAPWELDSESLPTNRTHARHLSKRQCSMTKPWLCDGVTCFNRFTHMCCKGGYTCGGRSFCARNALGQIFCRE